MESDSAKTSSRPSGAFSMASRALAGPPWVPSQPDQPPLGAVCQRWNTPSALEANTSIRPSALWPAASRWPPVPKFSQADQPPLGPVCHMWSNVLSESANSSSRPSALDATASWALRGPPADRHGDQAPFAAVCHAWYTPSAPAAKASRRPSADRPDTTLPEAYGCLGPVLVPDHNALAIRVASPASIPYRWRRSSLGCCTRQQTSPIGALFQEPPWYLRSMSSRNALAA